jgi:hypothetical protein
MDEEDKKHEYFLKQHAKREHMRAMILQAVDAFNAFNEREFPGEFLPFEVMLKEVQGTYRKIWR